MSTRSEHLCQFLVVYDFAVINKENRPIFVNSVGQEGFDLSLASQDLSVASQKN